ncbi:MAG: hypothetical protein WC798_03925 [Candidatus Paceibacterota bacterium]
MRNERTNLLPLGRQRLFRRDYFMRLGVVGASFVIALASVAALLLLPTYVFLVKSASAKKTHLASIESELSSANETALSAQITALSKNAAILVALAGASSVSEMVRSVLDVPRPGVTLSSLGYTSPEGKNLGTLTVSGRAATRDALRKYQLALEDISFARSANLPVSAYAKDANITFVITITLAP